MLGKSGNLAKHSINLLSYRDQARFHQHRQGLRLLSMVLPIIIMLLLLFAYSAERAQQLEQQRLQLDLATTELASLQEQYRSDNSLWTIRHRHQLLQNLQTQPSVPSERLVWLHTLESAGLELESVRFERNQLDIHGIISSYELWVQLLNRIEDSAYQDEFSQLSLTQNDVRGLYLFHLQLNMEVNQP